MSNYLRDRSVMSLLHWRHFKIGKWYDTHWYRRLITLNEFLFFFFTYRNDK